MINALKLGESLENPSFWKRIQLGLMIFGVFLPSLVLMIPELQIILDKGVLGETLTGVATVISYLTVTTTNKLGV